MTTPDTRHDWAWLKDTYWYVLPIDLPAPQFDPDTNKISWLVDQTVWHIVGYENGNLWGVTSVLMYEASEGLPKHGPFSSPNQLTLLGTVTPSGRVHLTFIPSVSLGTPTVGTGQMVEYRGSWGFEMQMSTDRRGSRIVHWATMVQTRPGDEGWEKLPGVPYSVPQMLDGAKYPTTDGMRSKS